MRSHLKINQAGVAHHPGQRVKLEPKPSVAQTLPRPLFPVRKQVEHEHPPPLVYDPGRGQQRLPRILGMMQRLRQERDVGRTEWVWWWIIVIPESPAVVTGISWSMKRSPFLLETDPMVENPVM